MKDSIVKLFSFLPSDYDCIEKYLEEKLAEGYRLKWIKGGVAGFVKNDIPNLRYVVEPYPNTNTITLKRMPKIRLNLYTENHWYFLAKTRGNYIFFTDDDEAEFPNLEEGSKAKIVEAETKRIGIFLVLLIFGAYTLLKSKAFMYSYVLTNMYIYASIILAFLALVSIAGVFVYSQQKLRLMNKTYCCTSQGGISRGNLYNIRNAGVIALILLFFIMETKSKPEMLILLAVPIVVMTIGALVIKKIADKNPQNASKNIMPISFIFGIIIMVLIVGSFTGIQKSKMSKAAQNADAVAAKAENLPVLHYSDFFDGADCTSRARELNSLFGTNYLFSENDDDGNIVFTNYTKAKTSFAADKIFDYLYTQAQTDYQGEFLPAETNDENTQLYEIKEKNSYLIRYKNTVVLMTISDKADEGKIADAVSAVSEKIKN